jgi:hypothetical protein
MLGGEIELDESYFGGACKGKRGRGTAGKVIVFGILKRGDRVYTKIITDTKACTLMPIIIKKISPDSIIYTDVIAVTTRSLFPGFTVIASITAPTLPSHFLTTSMASKTLEARQKESYENITHP